MNLQLRYTVDIDYPVKHLLDLTRKKGINIQKGNIKSKYRDKMILPSTGAPDHPPLSLMTMTSHYAVKTLQPID